MKKGHQRSTLFIVMLVMIVNALSYGTIIPLLYPYAQRFGINAVGLSWLFASFSLAQFIATPIIGRLSDKYGRKPLLLVCLVGTSLSLALFASAQSAVVLFVARILDGITGGNISVAQAVIADTTTGEDRAKGFGLLGAAFGFGFLVGPALGGLLSHFGLTAPFWFASALALVGTLLGVFWLPESAPPQGKRAKQQMRLFNFHTLAVAIFQPLTGIVLALVLLASIASNSFVIGFQSFTVDVLALPPVEVGLLFALYGLVSTLMQAVGIRWLLQWFKSKKLILTGSLMLSAIALLLVSLATSYWPFTALLFIHMIAGSPQLPMLSALLSERSKAEDQGGVMGIQQSYQSLGQIVGPLLAGVVASRWVPLAFILAAGLYGVGAVTSLGLYRPVRQKLDL